MNFKQRTLPQINFVINRTQKDNKVHITISDRDDPNDLSLHIDITGEAEKELEILNDAEYEQFLLSLLSASNMTCTFEVEVFTVDRDVTARFKEIHPQWRPNNE